MRNSIVAVIFGLFLVPTCFSQDFGYMGKKNTFSFFTTSSMRIISVFGPEFVNDQSVGYKTVKYSAGGTRKEGFKFIRYDIRAAYSRLLSKRVSLGAEFGYEKMRMTRNPNYYSEVYIYDPVTNDYYLEISNFASTPVLNVFSYNLTLSLHSSKALAPNGFNVSFGLGPKIFAFNRNQNYHSSQSNLITNPFPDYANNMLSINVFCQFSYRYLLTNFMTLDFGLRLQTGYVLGRDYSVVTGVATDSYWEKSDLIYSLRSENMFNLANFKFGVSFLL
jgi:hypothetical protein